MLVYDPTKIKELREQRGWSLKKAGEEAGISDNTWWRYEQGRVGMRAGHDVLTNIARALDVPLKAILAATQPPDLDDELALTISGLEPPNKAALLAAAKALRDSQDKK